MGFDAGSITATLELDRGPFQQQLAAARREGADFQDDTIKPKLDADEEVFDEKLDEAKAKLDDFGERTDTATLDVDDETAELKLEDVQARIDRLKSETASAKVDVNDASAKRKLTEIQAALDALGNESLGVNMSDDGLKQIDDDLNRLQGSLEDVSGSSSNASSGLDKTKKSADSANKSFGPSGLMGTALALSPALLDVGTVGAASLAGLAAAGATAAVGLGVFALAAYGDLATVKSQADAMLKSFQAATSASVMPALTGALGLLPTILSDVQPMVKSTASALEGLETDAENALTGPFWTGFTHMLDYQTGPAITAFGHLLGGAAQALAGLDEAFAPYVSHIEADLNRLGSEMAHFGANASSSSGIESFIAYIEKEGPVVASTVENIAHDILLLAQDAAPLGAMLLPVLDDAAKALGAVEQAAPGLIELATGLLAVGKAVSYVGGVTGIAATLKKVPEALTAIRNPATETTTALGGVASKASVLVEGAIALGGSLADLAGPAAVAGASLLGLFGDLNKFSDPSAKGATLWADSFVQSLQNMSNPVAAIKQEMASLNSQITQLQTTAAAEASSKNWNADQYVATVKQLQDVVDKYNDLQKQLSDVETQQKAVAAAVTAAGSAAANSSPATLSLAGYMTDLANNASATSSAISTLTSDISQLAGNSLDATVANDNFQVSIDNASASIKSGSLSGSALQLTLAQMAQTLYETLIPGWAKTGDTVASMTTKTQSAITQIDSLAKQSGMSAGDIQTFNQQLGLVPGTYTASIQAAGVASASAQVGTLQQQLNALARNYTASFSIAISDVQAIHRANVNINPIAISTIGGGASGAANGLAPTMGAHIGLVGENGPELMGVPGYVNGLRAMGRTAAVGWVGVGGEEHRPIPANAWIMPNAASVHYASMAGIPIPGHANGYNTSGAVAPLGNVAAAAVPATPTPNLTVHFEANIHGVRDAAGVGNAVRDVVPHLTRALQQGVGRGIR